MDSPVVAEDGRTIEAKATPLVMNGLALEGSDRGLSPETYLGFERAENFVAIEI